MKRRTSCGIFVMPGQSKAEAIRSMIQEKNKKELEKTIVVETNKKFNKEIEFIVKLEKEQKELQAQIKTEENKMKKIAQELNLEYSQGKFSLSWRGCYTPKKVETKLQEAINLNALGMKKESKQIYDDLIKEYKLI